MRERDVDFPDWTCEELSAEIAKLDADLSEGRVVVVTDLDVLRAEIAKGIQAGNEGRKSRVTDETLNDIRALAMQRASRENLE